MPRDVLGPLLIEAVEALVAELLAAAPEPSTEPWPEFLSVPEAARFCSVKPERIRKLLAAGTLARIQEAPGCRVLIATDDLRALMRSWRIEAGGGA
jgi:hypothetical protein